MTDVADGILTDQETAYLVRILDRPQRATTLTHAPGHGGLTRPIPIPAIYRSLINKGLAVLSEHIASQPWEPRRCRWVYTLTTKGMVLARMLDEPD